MTTKHHQWPAGANRIDAPHNCAASGSAVFPSNLQFHFSLEEEMNEWIFVKNFFKTFAIEIFLSLAHICKDTEIHTSIASTYSNPLRSFQTAFLSTPADRLKLKLDWMTVIPPISTFPPNRVEWLNGGNYEHLIAIDLEMVFGWKIRRLVLFRQVVLFRQLVLFRRIGWND